MQPLPPPPPVSVYVKNLSTVVQDVESAFRVLKMQANNDLHLYWSEARYVKRIKEIGPDEDWPVEEEAWRATIYDYPFQAQADDDLAYTPVSALNSIGYHFVDSDPPRPHLVLFATVGNSVGIPWTMVFSHELLEALVDPSTNATVPPRTEPHVKTRWEKEVCDPVEAQAYLLEDAKTGDMIWVSNFVTPAWFGPLFGLFKLAEADRTDRGRPRYDFAGQLIDATQLALGGERTRSAHGQDKTDLLTRFGSQVTAGS